MLTHGNFLNLSSNAKLAMSEIANPSNSTILFLPLAHALARTVQILALDSGMTVGHAPDIKNLTTDLQEFKRLCGWIPRTFWGAGSVLTSSVPEYNANHSPDP